MHTYFFVHSILPPQLVKKTFRYTHPDPSLITTHKNNVRHQTIGWNNYKRKQKFGWKLRFVLWCIIISLFTHITVLSNEKNFVFFFQLRLIIYGKGKSELRQANWKRTAKPFKDKVKFRFKPCARRLKFTLTKQHIALQKSSQLVSFHLFVNHRSLIGWSWPRIFVFHEYIGTYCSSK